MAGLKVPWGQCLIGHSYAVALDFMGSLKLAAQLTPVPKDPIDAARAKRMWARIRDELSRSEWN